MRIKEKFGIFLIKLNILRRENQEVDTIVNIITISAHQNINNIINKMVIMGKVNFIYKVVVNYKYRPVKTRF